MTLSGRQPTLHLQLRSQAPVPLQSPPLRLLLRLPIHRIRTETTMEAITTMMAAMVERRRPTSVLLLVELSAVLPRWGLLELPSFCSCEETRRRMIKMQLAHRRQRLCPSKHIVLLPRSRPLNPLLIHLECLANMVILHNHTALR